MLKFRTQIGSRQPGRQFSLLLVLYLAVSLKNWFKPGLSASA